MAHPFFQEYTVEEVRHFSPRGKFKVLKFNLPQGSWGRLLLAPAGTIQSLKLWGNALYPLFQFNGNWNVWECQLTDPVT